MGLSHVSVNFPFSKLLLSVRQSAVGFVYVAQNPPGSGSGQDQVCCCCLAAANDFVHKLFIKRNGPRNTGRQEKPHTRGETGDREVLRSPSGDSEDLVEDHHIIRSVCIYVGKEAL